MFRRKVVIKALEAVTAIRAGMDDIALMEKYNLSAEGLQTMMRELVAVGVLQLSEVEARPDPGLSSVALDSDPISFAGKARKKRVIDAAEAVKSIRSGMTDADLMSRYKISADGLQSLFKKLSAAGAIRQSEISERLARSHEAISLDETTTEILLPEESGVPVAAKEILRGLKSGMDYKTLMEEYGLTAKDFRTLLNKFQKEGLISEPELDREVGVKPLDFKICRKSSGEVIISGQALSFGALVEEAVSSGVDLSGADLSQRNLSRKNLSGARLARSDLRKTNLVGADLTGANMAGSNLVSAEMFGVILERANLSGANLSQASLGRAYAAWAFLRDANLAEADLTRANLKGANLANANLFEVILLETNLEGTYVAGTLLDNPVR
jgi:hypothetical protein